MASRSGAAMTIMMRRLLVKGRRKMQCQNVRTQGFDQVVGQS